MTATELMSRHERDAWEDAYESLIRGEADLVSRLAKRMRKTADSERASGIDPLHTLERLIQLTEDYAAELKKPLEG